MKQEYLEKLELAKRLLKWDTTLPREVLDKNIDKGCDLLEELVQIDDVNVLAVLLEFFNDENEDYGGVCETLMNDIWDNYSAEQIIEAVSQKFDYLVENDLSRFACLTSILLNEEDFEKFRAMFNEIKSKNSDKYLESLYKLCSDNYPSEINLLREDMKKW